VCAIDTDALGRIDALPVVERVGERVLHERLGVEAIGQQLQRAGDVGRQTCAAEAVRPVLAVADVAGLEEVGRGQERVVAVEGREQALVGVGEVGGGVPNEGGEG